MDDKKLPTSNTPSDVPPVGDTSIPPTPPMPEDTPPLPPLSPEKVKTPTLPIPKSDKKEALVEDVQPKTDMTTPPAPQTDDGVVVPKESVVMPQPEAEMIKSTSQPDQVEQPKVDVPIAPPEKEEMPVEAEFPGQPLPVEAQQNLEDKAKEMIDKDGGVKNRKVEVVGKPKGNVKKTLVGMLLFVLVGGGAFAGMKLMGNTTENRSQAGIVDPQNCPSSSDDPLCNPTECQPNNTIVCQGTEVNDIYKGCNYLCSYRPGNEVLRVNCCDGKWYTWNYDPSRYGENKAKDLACTGHGGWKNCNGPVLQCTCESWARACGVNCKFPEGVGYEGQKKADSLCKPIIAMCNVGTGKVTYEVFEEGHKCWGEENICKNPVYQPGCKEDPKACNESCTEGECDEGLVCDTINNTCRNPICPESVNCICPEGDLICSDLSCSGDDLELGGSYTFTCNAQVTGNKKIEDIQLYEFRYQRNTEGWVNLPLSASDPNVSSELYIEDPGNYVVQCRACEDRNDKTKCTSYQITTAN